MNGREGGADARESSQIAANSDGATPAALHQRGLQHMQAGRHLDAQLCCEQALAIDPHHTDSLRLMGLLCLQARQYDHAIAWIARANRADPASDDLLGLGIALKQQGLDEAALRAFDHAVQIRPDAESWTWRANVLVRLQRQDEAIESLDHALRHDPRYWQAAHNRAVLLGELGRFEEALADLNLCSELQPDHAPTLQARAATLLSLDRFEQALSEGRRAQALDPANADISNMVGVALQRLTRHGEAIEQFDRALALRPHSTQALDNKAATLTELRRLDEAIMAYRRIKDIDPDNAAADWNLSLVQLLKGDFEAGWRAREARWKIPSLPGTAGYPRFSQPMWCGERNIAGKTILVCADEGLGDTIQFVRYLPMLSALGARVILLPQESLHPLLSELDGISQCLPNMKGGLPAFDLHCPIMSLPFAFGTTLDTIPSPASCLPRPAPARVQAWEHRLGARDRLRVGLVWSGNPEHWNDRNRSIPLSMLSRILVGDATFVSLQKDVRSDDAAALRERGDIIDLTEHLTDFAETAALIACLDLVITVDTSVAHLAASLGCPTWILLPFVPDWRWLLDRDDSPWYPAVRLFRQTETRDYASVLDRVSAELRVLTTAKAKTAPTPAATPAALHQLAHQHMQAGRQRDAMLCCEQALASDPHHVDSLHLMGVLCLQAGQYDHAIAWIARVNRQDPKAGYLVSLGIALAQQGRPTEAFKAFDAAVEITPDDAETWLHHGNTLLGLQRPEQALASYQQVLRLDPRDANAAYQCGVLLRDLKRTEEALACFDLCDQLAPNNAVVLEQRGLLLHALKRYEEALDANLQAQAQRPESAELCNNIGAALLKLRRYEEALPWLDKALALLPGSVPVLLSKAAALNKMLRLDEAFAIYAQAKTLDPASPDIAFLISELQLLTGDFEPGWIGREARWKTRVTGGYPNLSQPMWLGDGPIAGKTILVFADEGLGDTIQFARYIPLLAARGARILLWVDDPLVSLMSEFPGISRLLVKSDPLPAFDLHCPICSLPLAFRTRLNTIPADSFLPRPAEARVQVWESRLQDHLGPRSRFRVGLVWSGNPNHWNDHNRSLRFEELTRLLELDAAFVSIQKDPRPDDKAQFARTGIVDLTADLTDLAETAALMSCLDLVITVDTSMAHLAGSLGRPTWILLPYTPDWRWLLGRDDSPWYRSARLFRQDQRRDYASVIERVREALHPLLSASTSHSHSSIAANAAIGPRAGVR